MSSMGLTFSIQVADIEEKHEENEIPEAFCMRLSYEKAAAIAGENPEAVVIGADTVVVIDAHILGKPDDETQARAYLKTLRAREHEVFTGYTILQQAKNRVISRAVRTTVTFHNMSDAEIAWYVATGEPMDKAGAYALQGIGAIFVDRIDGSHTNVIGLPVSELYQDLQTFGVKHAASPGGPLWEAV